MYWLIFSRLDHYSLACSALGWSSWSGKHLTKSFHDIWKHLWETSRLYVLQITFLSSLWHILHIPPRGKNDKLFWYHPVLSVVTPVCAPYCRCGNGGSEGYLVPLCFCLLRVSILNVFCHCNGLDVVLECSNASQALCLTTIHFEPVVAVPYLERKVWNCSCLLLNRAPYAVRKRGETF